MRKPLEPALSEAWRVFQWGTNSRGELTNIQYKIIWMCYNGSPVQ
jgi:hypothetical protein